MKLIFTDISMHNGHVFGESVIDNSGWKSAKDFMQDKKHGNTHRASIIHWYENGFLELNSGANCLKEVRAVD